MRWMIAGLALMGACAAPAAQTPTADTATLMAGVMSRLEAHRGDLIELRRDIHRNPEVSGEEERTAALVAARLQALGFDVRRNVGGHGVVGVLRGGRSGRVIAFRADMDAVRDDSHDPVEFRSVRPGVRHICGHDVHTTIGIALAESFAAIREDLPGTVVLYFQPAEERGDGARAMLNDGAMDAPRPDAVFGVHTTPYEVGTFVTSESVLMTIRDRARISVSGGNAQSVAQGIVARLGALNSAPPFEPQPATADWVNVDVGAPQAGEGGGVNAFVVFNLATAGARANMRRALDDAIADARRANPNAQIAAQYEDNWMPGIQNNAAVTRNAVASIRAELGEGAADYSTTVIPAFSEDFGHMQALAPSTFFFIGVSNSERGWVGMPHTPNYVADEEAIFVGARAMARVMLDAMRQP
jgi:metal-dependent amidase/aminoacylase/carboxypeptidase family protein